MNLIESLLLTTQVCGAYAPPDSTASALPPDLISWWQLVKAGLALAVVLVLIWLTLTALKRTLGSRYASPSGVKLLGGIPLGARRSIQFILIGKRLYILGATDHNLNLIDRIDDPQIIEEMVQSQPGNPGVLFSRLLERLRPDASRPEKSE